MPANVYALFSELPLFTAKDGRATQEIQSGYDPEHFGVGTADAETSFQVNWILKDGRTIPAEYYFSWIGVPNDDGLRAEIGKHEIPDNWLGSKVVDLKQVGMSLAIGYRIEEARIGIIDGVLNGNETQIICNFLGKTDLGLARPWIRIVSGSACKELDLVSLPFGNNSLARVLQRISNCCAGNTSAPLLDKGSITIVHGIMKDVAKEAFKSPRTPQDEIRVTKDLFRSRLCLPS